MAAMRTARRTGGALVAAALLWALALAACGDDDDDAPASDATATVADTATATEAGAPALHIGAVLPETGSLAFLGVPMIAAVRLAVEDVNAAGGNLRVTMADSATDPATGLSSVQRLLGEGAHAIVGAGASAVSQAFVQTLSDERTPQCAASNTSPVFTTQANADYYFRTIAPDTAMAPVIADAVVGRGAARIAVIGRADAWGNALAALLEEEFARLGAESLTVLYDPEEPSRSAEVSAVVNYAPDMVVNLGFSSDGADTVRQLLEAGVGPERQFAATGLYSPDLWQAIDPNAPSVLDGMLGIQQGGDSAPAFLERLAAATGGDYLAYGAEAYDCVVLLALAALAAGDPADGAAMLAAVGGLTRGGVECASYGECAALLAQGRDIDYTGVSGPLNLDAVGDPTVAAYTLRSWADGGQVLDLGAQAIDLEDR